MKKVAIIGFGFVGKALVSLLDSKVEIIKIDPKLGTKTQDLALFRPDIVFVCLPTPMNENGNQDTSIIEDFFESFIKLEFQCPVVVKSTVLPTKLIELNKNIKNLAYNPEFLREKHAKEDMLNTTFNILGGDKKVTKLIADFYDKHSLWIEMKHIFVDIQTASFIKYSMNSFLSHKVIFFNELYNLFEKINSKSSWNEFIDVLKHDNRIGNSHMNVPGHDERLGYGGACFPKDSNALLNFSQLMNSELSLLKSSIDINNNLRSGYNSLTDREKEQNISFKKDKKGE